ncbi:MAG: guanylate cyclase [Rhodobacteraceae bacterium]|nr:MAG: guanylate cyclase [Paracoccaceae bacterium]
MKGIVFVELIRMAETVIGEEAVDTILDQCDLSTDGAYSAVGNYPCAELITLVEALSKHTGTPSAELQRLFGKWMHEQFVTNYPAFFTDKSDALAMLSAIEDEVHVEVRKLYPDAELPRFETEHIASDELRMVYRSPRPLSDFCHGLVEGCVDHFGHRADIRRKDLSGADEHACAFTIHLRE